MMMPEKPEKQGEQISMLWDAVFNHIPTKLKWVSVKLNFVLVFLALILAFQGIIILKG